MKSHSRSFLISSMLCAMLAVGAASANAQDAVNPEVAQPSAEQAPTEQAPSDQDQAAQVPAEQDAQPALDGNAPASDSPTVELNPSQIGFYDTSLLDPEVKEKTVSKTEAARSTLEQTHGSEAIPGKVPDPEKMQSLPGEEVLQNYVDQISELNEIKPGQPLTLRDALILADENNVDLQAARVKIDTAKAQLKQAWALLLPNISSTLSYGHLGTPTNATASVKQTLGAIYNGLTQSSFGSLLPEGTFDALSPANIPDTLVTDSIAFNLTFGLSIINVAGWFQLRMLDEAKDITELGIENGRQQLLIGISQAYMAALLCGEVVKVQRVQLKSALDQLTLAQGRYDRGVDVKLSVIQAQFAVEKQRQALINAIWSYESARDSLATLVNIDGLPVPQPTRLDSLGNKTEKELEDEAVAQNRTLKINRMTQHINQLNLNAAIASFLPTVNGAWMYDYTWARTYTSGLSDWSGKDSWTLAVSINIPLFDYSKYGVLDERRAAIRETDLSLESTELATRQAVRKAIRDFNSAIFDVDNAKRQVELAREAMQLTEAAYKNGASTFIDVSDARNNVAAASIAYITANLQAELSYISLISTLGRDIMLVVP
ncbi:MAG: TolC family protein [Proteobacteria bacterium]|nr:TolC family protein [Pseudomonadota bacterium]